jgi:hypothetical protein
MLRRLTDEEWTVVVTLPSAWFPLCLSHGVGTAGKRTGAAGHRWRWGEPALSSVSRR